MLAYANIKKSRLMTDYEGETDKLNVLLKMYGLDDITAEYAGPDALPRWMAIKMPFRVKQVRRTGRVRFIWPVVENSSTGINIIGDHSLDAMQDYVQKLCNRVVSVPDDDDDDE